MRGLAVFNVIRSNGKKFSVSQDYNIYVNKYLIGNLEQGRKNGAHNEVSHHTTTFN